MRVNKIKRFNLITESSEELTIKLNHRENVGLFVLIVIIFLSTYFFLYFDIYYMHFIFDEIQSNVFPVFLISIIFFPLTGFFAILLIRSLFFTLIIRIDKNNDTLYFIYNYLGYIKKRIIYVNDIKNIYIRENKTHTTYGLRMSNFTLNVDLSDGKIIRVIGSSGPSELRKLEKLIMKNISI